MSRRHIYPVNVDKLLRNPTFTKADALAALQGIKLPHGLARRVLRLCVIHGIRYHPSFADGAASVLRAAHERPEFARALNARAIMSGLVPDMDPEGRPQDLPYCIWHPTVPSEDALRRLVARYPAMTYQVGRACAVGGYTTLYRELDILPEVAIAEEARAAGSTDIFADIMAHPVRYRVFNDYTRAINSSNPAAPAYLNGDTAVRDRLDVKQAFEQPRGQRDPDDPAVEDWQDDKRLKSWELGFRPQTFDITEDQSIDEHATFDRLWREEPLRPFEVPMANLLVQPLPPDLPEGEKGLLILMAAYNGDIDRYARLRRPVMLRDELFCLMRGAYHHPLFAAWLVSLGEEELFARMRDRTLHNRMALTMALRARAIMNNDLSRLPSPAGLSEEAAGEGYVGLPYLIWYPTLAAETTYAELARRLPQMRQAVARAAVFGGMRTLFDSLLDADANFCPDWFVLLEATANPNGAHYRAAIEARAAVLGVDMSDEVARRRHSHEDWKRYSVGADTGRSLFSAFPRSSNRLGPGWGHGIVLADRENIEAIYNGVGCDASMVELAATLPVELKPKGLGVDPEVNSRDLDYVEWPPAHGTSPVA
ncbi:hypothetical protein B0T16DRAFT_457287 [Cercophora newfieldiana]|uniref:Uncharacterized protein n=1 Tax=Cercophora newfieldiana TaxID=92897 RepID=A0AA40CSR9_9PEZI|nr:hypothetical protein B0T16DRAFT_457287 [Cercophora newfieldiana]